MNPRPDIPCLQKTGSIRQVSGEMRMRRAEKAKYVYWYRLAAQALGDLVPHPEKDSEIKKWVSEENWLLIPKHEERSLQEARNRPDPNIYFSLEDGTIRVGLICSTIRSVEKMQNLLTPYHTTQEDEFLSYMRGLPDDFSTIVWAKEKPHHPLQTPDYHEKFRAQSNRIDEASTREIFRLTNSLASEGRELRKVDGKKWTPVSPVLEIAVAHIPPTDQEFLIAIARLGPLYSICLKVKTDAELKRELRRRVIVGKCPKDGRIFNPPPPGRFCPDHGAFLEIYRIPRTTELFQKKP